MPDYRETTAEATSYRRAFAVRLNNPLGGVGRSVAFDEEDVIVLPDRTITQLAGTVAAAFNPPETFALIDPQTGLLLGSTASHMEVYVLLNSLYLDLALKRDAAALAAQTPPELPPAEPEATP